MAQKDKEKIQVSIYRIDRESPSISGMDFHSAVAHIITSYNERREKGRFAMQSLAPDLDTKGLDVKIFWSSKETKPRWVSFLEKALEPGSDLLTKPMNTDVSFVCFVGCEPNIFAVSGGQGNLVAQDYADENFGLGILSRLIEKDSPSITSLQERGVTGAVLGSSKFFRNNQSLAGEDQFGKIYREIRAKLGRDILVDEFDFAKEDVKKESMGCLAKTSFQIAKAIDFSRMLEIAAKITKIWARDPKFPVNHAKQLSGKPQNKELVAELNRQLLLEIYEKVARGELDLDFDLCNKNFAEYLSAHSYRLRSPLRGADPKEYDENPTLESVLEYLVDSIPAMTSSPEVFEETLRRSYIESRDADNKILTSGSLPQHLHGELTLRGKIYFFIDGKWYQIDDEFIDDLNRECERLLSSAEGKTPLDQDFNHRNEDDYIESFIGKSGYLALHRKMPDGIEGCDLLKIDEDSVHFVHIKDGFNNSIRELAGQISVAARRIRNDIKSDRRYLNSLEAAAKKISKKSDRYLQKVASQDFPPEGLGSLIASKGSDRIKFCLAFFSDMGPLRGKVSSFKSNIAKISLINLSKEVRNYEFDFSITQIKYIGRKAK